MILMTVFVSGLFSTIAVHAATYSFQQGTGTIVAGTDDTGNHCDDCTTNIALPFAFTLYGVNYTSATVGANGNLQFGAGSGSNYAGSASLPIGSFNVVILPLQTDLRTDQAGGGIYISVSGAAPNRIFNIEWRAVVFGNTGASVNFEVRLFEGSTRFDIIYGVLQNNGAGVVGVQKDGTDYTQYSGIPTAGLQLTANVAPTAAAASFGGRIETPDGNGLRNALVILTDAGGNQQSVTSGINGSFRFDDLRSGEAYIVSVVSKRFVFPSQVFFIGENLDDIVIKATAQNGFGVQQLPGRIKGN